MNTNVLEWYEKKEHIEEMKGWDKGKLKIWEQRVVNNFPFGAKILDIGSGMGREAFALYQGIPCNTLGSIIMIVLMMINFIHI